MTDEPNRIQLIGYLDEALPAEEMTRIEDCLRQSENWRAALQELLEEVGSGDHSLATIWRRHRLTCPSRERLGAYHVGGLVPDETDYIRFHLEVVKCRWCLANLQDIEAQQRLAQPVPVEVAESTMGRRRRRFFETSVGYLPAKDR